MKYLSLFSGIGGFELGLLNSNYDFECVGYSEIDKYARSIYERNFPEHINFGDATKIETKDLPDFDFLVGGFPCQAFSVAGKRRGFDDTRGTLFFEIARILKDKRPRYFLLENVKGLLSHDKGKTFKTILEILSDLRYDVRWKVHNSKDYGVPQNRERVFIEGYSRRECSGEVLSPRQPSTENIGKVNNKKPTFNNELVCLNKGAAQAQKVYDPEGVAPTLSACGGGDGGKTGLYIVPDERKINIIANSSPTGHNSQNILDVDGLTPTLTATDYKHPKRIVEKTIKLRESTKKGYKEAKVGDGVELSRMNCTSRRGVSHEDATGALNTDNPSWGTITPDYRIRKLTPRECERLQAFPDDWTKYGKDGETISNTQRYKCCGNAVTTTVITAIVNQMFEGIL